MSFVYLAVMWLAYGVLRATTDDLLGTCESGSARGQTTQADCNPACFPMGVARAYCSDYHDGFAQGTLAESGQGYCISGIKSCDCHKQAIAGGLCSCGSSTMDRHFCYKSTKTCVSCPAGQTAPCGCDTASVPVCYGGDGLCVACGAGTFKDGDGPGGCTIYYGGYDTRPQNLITQHALSPGKNYSIPFASFIPKLTCFLGGCRNILFIIKYC
jgi:hypothetical protein